ncbi:MAG: hypothetical protein WBG73_01460 [Coleofasciculaceae cyanobacterium]
MTPSQYNSSLAFLSALKKLNHPLPADIQAQVNEIGKALSNDPTQLVNLDIIAESYKPLDELYQDELIALDNVARERSKGLSPEPLPTQTTEEITNLAIDMFSEVDSVAATRKPENTNRLKRIWQIITGNN